MFEHSVLIGLVLVSSIAGLILGVGGPGGSMLITSLYLMTSLKPSQIAAASSPMILGACVISGSGYLKSGDIDTKIILFLIPTTFIGSQIGVYLSQFISEAVFGYILAFLLASVGLSIIYREIREIKPVDLDMGKYTGKAVIAFLGLFVGICSGIIGLGGGGISTPVMIALGIPPLIAIGSGLTQSVFATSSTAASYAFKGMVDWQLVTLLGAPFLLSAGIGWYLTRYIDADRIEIVLGVILILSTPLILI
jgi:uncharacterized membrane protein YfcA